MCHFIAAAGESTVSESPRKTKTGLTQTQDFLSFAGLFCPAGQKRPAKEEKYHHMQQNRAIRKASPGDEDIVSSITNAAYAKYVPLMGRKPQPMTADYQRILAEHPVWILWIDEQPAGVLVLMHEPEAMLIYSVAIAPAYQKSGLGRRLLAWAEAEAQRAGYAHIRLYTNALMEANIALYTRLGYVETRREPFHELTVVHMRKPIQSPEADP